MKRRIMKIHCAHTKLVDPGALVPNPKNPNDHTDEQIEILAKVIRFNGWRSPITVSKRSGFIVCGHGRLAAAKLAGCEEVPVDEQEFENEAAEHAHLMADNFIHDMAEMNKGKTRDLALEIQPFIDLELAGINEKLEIKLGLDAPEESGVDAEPKLDQIKELQAKWKTERGQRWSLGPHSLFCGDSTNKQHVEALMNGESARIVMTSPPYAQQREYGEEYDENQDWDSLMLGVFDAMISDDDAQLIVNLGLTHKNNEVVQYWSNWIRAMRERSWLHIGWYVWDQGGGFPGASRGRLGISHEFVFHFGKKMVPALKVEEKAECSIGPRPKSDSMGRAKDGKKKKISSPEASIQTHKIPDSIARIPRGNIENVDHPAVYPVKLPLYFLRAWLGIIYDPFLGSGTTMIAAEKIGRVCYGMELDPGYVAVILERYFDATGENPKLNA